MGFGTALFANVQFSISNRKIRFKEEIEEKILPFTLSNSAMNLAGSDFSSLEVHAIEYTIPGAYELITTNRF
jgi:hypothetical protein